METTEMDQTDQFNKKGSGQQPKKRHGNGWFALIAIILLLMIAGMAFFCGKWFVKWRQRQDLLDFVRQETVDVGENTPQTVIDRIVERELLPLEVEIVDVQPYVEPEDLPVTETDFALEEEPETMGTTEEGTEADAELSGQEDAEGASQGGSVAPEDRVIDFATLQSKKNAHIYAWISVPGTNIDYPVLRHPTDDGYYLYHNLNGSQGYPGCIYTENWNSKDFTDPVTVLYGHDMRSTGTMFHQLHKFEKQSFFDKNQYIYVYTPEKTLKYQIFATYVHSNEHLLYNHNFSNEKEFDSFFSNVLGSDGGVNHVRSDMVIDSNSKIITLSTCIKNKPDNRYLVFGVLLGE